MATESTPMKPVEPEGATLVLSPHARLGRQLSIVIALLFMYGFNTALFVTATLNWGVPCDQPYNVFLLTFGLLGLAASALYTYIEMGRAREKPLMLPKLGIVGLLFAVTGVGLTGILLLSGAAEGSHCHLSSPIVYKWVTAAVLAFCVYVGLVLLVPLCSLLFPTLSLAASTLSALLAMLAAWMQDASRTSTSGVVGIVRRMVSGELPEPQPTIINPASAFALYVNTTALLWFFGYLLLEASHSWTLPCDVPLQSFVTTFALVGIALSLADFLREVFKNPMPPLTKLEQSSAREGRQRRMQAYVWLGGAAALWGLYGLLAISRSSSCAHTAPGLYRISLVLTMAFSACLGVAALVSLSVAVDFCCSGKLRVALVFER